MTGRAGLTRGRFLAGTAGAVVAGAARPAVAPAQGDDAAVAWFNASLRAEFVLVALLEAAIDRVDLSADARRLVEATSNDDQGHTRGLENLVRAAGGTPVRQPVVDTGGLGSEDDALSRVADLKATVITGYNAALLRLDTRLAGGSLAGIANVEAQHVAVLRMAAGGEPVERALGRFATLGDLRAATDPYVRARASAGSG